MFEKLGPEARDIVVLSQEIAQSMGHGEVRGEHLLLALFERMDKELANEFADIGITYEQLLSAVQADHPTKDSLLEGEFVELSAEAQIIIARSAQEAIRLSSKFVLPKHIFIAFEWYGVAERGNFYAWELLKKSGPEHSIRALFGNIEFRTPSKKRDKPAKARRRTDLENARANSDVIKAAQFEARSLGHNLIGPEHILLAFTADPQTFGAQLLWRLGIYALDFRSQLEAVFQPRTGYVPQEIPFSDDAKSILELSFECARSSDDNFIGDEHILLAFVRTGKKTNFQAWQIIQKNLLDKNADLEKIVEKMLSERKVFPFQKFPVQPAPSPNSTIRKDNPVLDWISAESFESKYEILDAAQDAAFKHGHNKVGTQYLLYALARTPATVACEALDAIGLHPNALDRILLEKFGRGPLKTKTAMMYTQSIPLIATCAKEIAAERDSDEIATEDWLRAIIKVGKQFDGCVAWEIICNTGMQDLLEEFLANNKENRIDAILELRKKINPANIVNVSDTELDRIFKKMLIKSFDDAAPEYPDLGDPWKESIDAQKLKDKHQIFEAAQEAALKHGHRKVGTQYLLFALSRTPNSVASEILEKIGLNPLELNRLILEKHGRGPYTTRYRTVFSEGFVSIYELACEIAKTSGCEHVESVHFLHAIAQAGNQFSGFLAWELICESGKQKKLEELLSSPSNLIRANRINEHQAIDEFRKKTQGSTVSASMPDFFSKETVLLFRYAKEEARLLNHAAIGAEHVFLGILAMASPEFFDKLVELNFNLLKAREALGAISGKGKKRIKNDISLADNAKRLLEIAYDLTRQFAKKQVEPLHILIAISKMPEDDTVSKVLAILNIKKNWVEDIFQILKPTAPAEIKQEIKYVPESAERTIPENFSETSIRVVENAHKEAWRFGFPKIQPEHLLLGLIKETSNDVSTMFSSRSITLKKLEDELNKIEDRGPGGSSILYVSDMVKEIFDLASNAAEDLVEPIDLLGYLILSMDLTTITILRNLGLEDLFREASELAPPAALFEFLNKNGLNDYFVSDSLKIIFRAQEIARQFGHKVADVEHLLIATLEWHEDKVVKLLLNNRLRVDELRKDLRITRGLGSIYPTTEIRMTPSALDVLKEATRRMETLKHSTISPGHMALGILQCNSVNLCKILKKYDLPADLADQIVIALSGKNEK